jgi:hypothetical protein
MGHVIYADSRIAVTDSARTKDAEMRRSSGITSAVAVSSHAPRMPDP